MEKLAEQQHQPAETLPPPSKRSLLQRYDIPINHLDFDYIKSCVNAKEVERIVAILKSGEEGYYPDLANCAENRLQQLNPQSKVLRKEVPLLNKSDLAANEYSNIFNCVEVKIRYLLTCQ